MSKRALIVVDIQNDYFPGGKLPLVGVDLAADNAAKVIAATRNAKELVIHIRHEFPAADAPFFVAGSEGAQIHAKARHIDGETVVVKNHVNSFRETALKKILEDNEIDELVILGSMSHMCIDGLTRAAVDYGYKATVIHDACATRDLEFNGLIVPAAHVHAAFMSALGFAYAEMKSTDEYLAK